MIKPIEKINPEIGKFFQDIANRRRPYNIKQLVQINDEILFISGPIPKRNEPCYCGSGRKYKKCCQKFNR